MATEYQAILAAALRFVRSVPPEIVDGVCEKLQTLTGEPAKGDLARLLVSVVQPQVRERLSCLLAVWAEQGFTPDFGEFSWLIRGVSAAQESSRTSQLLSIVWTGPCPGGTLVRRTDQALLDLIEAADSSIILVTFAAYRVPTIASALVQAARRGVEISMILESAEESDGRLTHDALAALGPEVSGNAYVYVWPREQREADSMGRVGSLHVKCAVADGRLLLLSSANLTEFAMNVNMELGLLVEGGECPAQIARHFQDLIAERVLVRVR